MANGNSDYSFTLSEEGGGVRMVVLGVGGMGNNAVENLARVAIPGLELYSLNTDIQPLRHCRGSKPLQLGAKRTRGKGTGGDSDLGRMSAEDDVEKIRNIVRDAELVFVASGMGGGTGTGAAPVIARICREVGVLTICVVTTPMDCEGQKRAEKSSAGLDELRKSVDSLLIIENEKLSMVMDQEDVSIIEVFRRADKVVVDAVAAVAKIINSHGYINLDLADLKKVIKRGSDDSCIDAFIGIGEGSGPDRAMQAAQMALSNPLMRVGSIDGAQNLLVNVVGSDQMGHKEAMAAVKCIVDAAGNLDREIFMGVVPDNSMGDKLSVTVIATGLGNRNSTVVPLRAGLTEGVNASGVNFDTKFPGKTSAPARIPLGETPINISEPDAAVYPDLHPGTHKKVSDGFGLSPLVRKDEWHIPAYLRCRAGHLETIAPQRDALVRNILSAECLGESGSGLDEVAETKQYRQSLYNMAG